MKARRLEEFLAITATAITHRAGLRSECQRAHSVEKPQKKPRSPPKIRRDSFFTACRNSYRVFYRVPADGRLPVKPAKLLLFSTGDNTKNEPTHLEWRGGSNSTIWKVV